MRLENIRNDGYDLENDSEEEMNIAKNGSFGFG